MLQCVAGDQGVERADGGAFRGEGFTDFGGAFGGGAGERKNGDRIGEGFEEFEMPIRISGVERSLVKLLVSDRGNEHFRGTKRSQPPHQRWLISHQPDRGVRIQEVHHQMISRC